MSTVHRSLAAVLVITALSVGPASAAEVSGRQLLSLCAAGLAGADHPVEAAECTGFIAGVADTFDCVEANHGARWNSKVNLPEAELAGLVIQYIQSHPEALESDAHRLVGAALAAAYPCRPRTAAK
ncbi:hypothetical protein DK847_12460 [Aestuariivirga litoralis]|uniref:Rap1a immunity protein domain-containing protein n=1 Tax=Aestuariivirga litoralis TaxID=2650924 RepID=A0A2W2BT28_9HYPH|nr:Rap1a/Tai family immunity protein [Aestuariivirga litoralis]PZF76606.1 hypothetical protein DK847_12460 [Aestuariivirga litoralis]